MTETSSEFVISDDIGDKLTILSDDGGQSYTLAVWSVGSWPEMIELSREQIAVLGRWLVAQSEP